jgi:hypothetical protein
MGEWIPSYGVACRELNSCVIASNTLQEPRGASLLVDHGRHADGLIGKDNPDLLNAM